MKKRNALKNAVVCILYLSIAGAFLTGLSGCGAGYSNKSLFPDDVQTIYVEMFESQSFWRGVEYRFTDALTKRIEADTPYKIVFTQDKADSVVTGQIVSVNRSAITSERQTGRALEKEATLEAIVSWKNLRTGKLLINNETVSASASYSEWQEQGFDYATGIAANNLARKIVELMEK